MTTESTRAPVKGTNGMSVAGFVIACLLATVLWPINLFLPFISVLVAVLGIVLSSMGIKKAEVMAGSGRGLGIAGLVINIVCTVGIGIWALAWIALAAS